MTIEASVNYHIKSDGEQAFRFDVDGIVGNLDSPELVQTAVRVTDLRGHTSKVDFDADGISFEQVATKVTDFESSSDWEAVYNNELCDLLRQKISAQEIIVFDHTVRVDDPNAARKPARNVHNDYSDSSAQQRLTEILGPTRAREFRNSDFGFVNVWRPLESSIKSSPLGFIRPRSMSPEDWVSIELIYSDRRGQILGVAANEAHEWFYLSSMSPDEVAIFTVYDSTDRPHLAHSALDVDGDFDVCTPRKSIESRILVRY